MRCTCLFVVFDLAWKSNQMYACKLGTGSILVLVLAHDLLMCLPTRPCTRAPSRAVLALSSCRADAPTRLRIVVVDRATRRSRSADGSDLSEGRPLANHTHQPLAYSEQVRSPFIGPTVGPSSGLNFLASGFSLLGLKPGPVQVLPRGLQPLRPMHVQTDPANNKSNRSVVKSSQTNNQVKRTAQPGDGSHGHAAPDEHLRIAGLTSAAHSEQLLHMVRYEHEST
jgi:hypothetical protein